MNTGVGKAQIGQWYLRWDTGEAFQVTGIDEHSKTIEVQAFDGDLDEIDEDTWRVLPLGFAEPPEDWTGPVDDGEVDDLGYSETDLGTRDWARPLQPFTAAKEEEAEREEGEEEPEEAGYPILRSESSQ